MKCPLCCDFSFCIACRFSLAIGWLGSSCSACSKCALASASVPFQPKLPQVRLNRRILRLQMQCRPERPPRPQNHLAAPARSPDSSGRQNSQDAPSTLPEIGAARPGRPSATNAAPSSIVASSSSGRNCTAALYSATAASRLPLACSIAPKSSVLRSPQDFSRHYVAPELPATPFADRPSPHQNSPDTCSHK